MKFLDVGGWCRCRIGRLGVTSSHREDERSRKRGRMGMMDRSGTETGLPVQLMWASTVGRAGADLIESQIE